MARDPLTLSSSDDHSSSSGTAAGHAKANKLISQAGKAKRGTRPASSVSRAVVKNKQGISSPIVARPRRTAGRPTMKVKTDAEALTVDPDCSDDLLLLTSKGWEWDPLTKEIVPSV